MRLSDLLAISDLDPAIGAIEIAGLSADSRAIRAGEVFFAIPGHAGDGLSFVADAKADWREAYADLLKKAPWEKVGKDDELEKLVALAKTKPGKLSVSSPGVGSATHLRDEAFNVAAGVPQDFDKSAHWARKAAEAGSADAQALLAPKLIET
mgnify:CR=1 FL=1